MLVAAAIAIVLKNNLERIGPLALASLIGVAALGCYAFVWMRRARPSIVDDYILLLGALLVSADVAFIENQFHLFGEAWYRHFAVLAVVHGVTAYLYNSRTLLTLAVVAMCSWLGVQQSPLPLLDGGVETSVRLLACLSLVLIWRFANRREEFHPILEHFAFNLMMLAPFALVSVQGMLRTACLLTIIAAALVIYLGFRLRRESVVLYGFVYGVIAVDVLLTDLVHNNTFTLFLILVSMVAAVAALFAIHSRFRELRA